VKVFGKTLRGEDIQCLKFKPGDPDYKETPEKSARKNLKKGFGLPVRKADFPDNQLEKKSPHK
tara:strand:- start:343 stop:531 length:189 start_codon:yes stop_codon:yes gene_type:complete